MQVYLENTLAQCHSYSPSFPTCLVVTRCQINSFSFLSLPSPFWLTFCSLSHKMRVAIPVWQESVSPVFDVARNLLLVDVKAGVEQKRWLEPVNETDLLARAGRLKALSVSILLCGAVSWPLEQTLVSAGIEVIPHLCGDVNEVLGAYLSGRLWDRIFVMPGCGGRRHRWGRGRGARHGFGPWGSFQ
jgi:predicted Fe-Mo cluster-binding NifX family protein